METLRQRLKEKDETIERQLQTVKAAQQEKKNSDSRFHEITEHMKVKERKICVLQRKVRDSSLCFLLTMVLVCLLTGGVLTWLSVWSEVQTLSTAQLMPLPLTVSCFSKIQLVLPFWYWLTWVVPDKGPLNVSSRLSSWNGGHGNYVLHVTRHYTTAAPWSSYQKKQLYSFTLNSSHLSSQ